MKNDGNEIEPVSAELMLPPDASLALVAERLVDQAKHDGVSLTGEGGLLTGLVQQVLQSALETEMTDHLGYEQHSSQGWGWAYLMDEIGRLGCQIVGISTI